MCEECYYYVVQDHERGFCHRFPPDNGIVKVKADWWCGEWRLAQKTEGNIPVDVIEPEEVVKPKKRVVKKNDKRNSINKEL